MFNHDCDNAAALTSAFMEAEPMLRAQLSKFLSRSEDIDDILYESYTKAYDAMKTSTIASPKDYLMRVARNLAINEVKKHANRFEDNYDPEAMNSLQSPAQTAEEVILLTEKQALLEDALATLPERCRKAFELRCKKHLSYKEIAISMGVSVKTVEKHLANAIKLCTAAIKHAQLSPTATVSAIERIKH